MSFINFYKNLKIILSTLKTIQEEDSIKFMREANRTANSEEKKNSIHNFLKG